MALLCKNFWSQFASAQTKVEKKYMKIGTVRLFPRNCSCISDSDDNTGATLSKTKYTFLHSSVFMQKLWFKKYVYIFVFLLYLWLSRGERYSVVCMYSYVSLTHADFLIIFVNIACIFLILIRTSMYSLYHYN